MPTLFTLHEPSPTTHPSTKQSFGRGGAGNRTHPHPPTMLSSPITHFTTNTRSSPPSSSSSSSSTSPSSTTSSHNTTTSTHTLSTSGRGGAGNLHTSPPDEDRCLFRFDEELERQVKCGGGSLMRSEACAPVYHIGRGGKGNLVIAGEGERRRRGSWGSEGEEMGEGEDRRGGVASAWIRGVKGGRRS